jgi:hypothetical protein
MKTKSAWRRIYAIKEKFKNWHNICSQNLLENSYYLGTLLDK